MSPRRDVSAQRKMQILDAASAVFARSGFHESRMDDIAAAAGLSKGALYLYFDGKDAIIAALMRRLFELELKDLRELRASAAPFPERLVEFTRHLARQYEQISADLPIVREFYAVAARQKSVRAFLRDYLRVYRDLIAGLIQEGIDRGELRRVDPRAAAIGLLAVYEGLLVLWTVDPRAIKWDAHCETAIQLFLAGLRDGASAAPRRDG